MRRSLWTGCAISVSLPPAIRRRNSRPGCTEKCSAGRRSPRRRTSRPTSDEKAMTGALAAIDCDVHPTVRDMTALLPHLDDFWRATVVERGINSLETVTYPPNAPLTARPQWRDKNGRAATTAAELTGHVCDRWQAGVAILNCLYGVGLIFSEDMAFAFTRALNDWVAKEWLDRDAAAEHRICGRRDRALRQGPPLRADPGARHAGNAARPPPLLADLCSGRTPRSAARHPCRLDLP